jgi:glycosyltransferase involved in cell wall biosynthesis
MTTESTRIVRVIARLNIGGPAIQAITLTERLSERGYATTLIRGHEEPDEGNMDHLAQELGVEPVLVPSLRRNPGWRDLPALVALVRIMRRERPQIVHTHAAKGGALGRIGALIASIGRGERPVLLHTFHGHSLSGYFAPRTAWLYRRIEQLLARFTDRLIAVSDEVRDELVALGVAPASKFVVVPLGFDLSSFTVDGLARQQARERVRAELGIPEGARVVTLIARLVPIKRVDRFLRVASVLHDLMDVRFLVVGDGHLREHLQSSPEARALGDRLVWAGFRRDMPAVCFASDVVVLTSDNEGTPVSLIEAQAAGVPVVSVDVGGAASVVKDGETGFLVPSTDVEAFAHAVREICCDPDLADQLGNAGRARACSRFELNRLVDDTIRLYEEPTARRRDRTAPIQAAKPARIVQVLSRLNIGGPAIQAITLTERLSERGYATTLIRGHEEPDEGNMDHLAQELGVEPVLVPSLRRNPGWRDLPALVALVRIMRRERPQIVHTHAAKGGALGRIGALIASIGRGERPVLLHTFHGHSLSGYFAPRTAWLYRRIEQLLARFTDRLIAVSDEVRDELVALGVAPASKFVVVPLGFDLSSFTVDGLARQQARERVRAELGIPEGARVVTLIARLVPIKRVDRFLRVASVLHDLMDVRFLVVGDGHLREHLQSSPEARALGDRLVWAGFRRDMPAVCFASDVVVLTSDNEGTPVSLIEAQAAGVPVVSVDVGGAASVVKDGETGFLVPSTDVEAFAHAVREICCDPDLADQLGNAGRARACSRFELNRLVDDTIRLYEEPTARRRDRTASH